MTHVSEQSALPELRESYLHLLKLALTGMAAGEPYTVAPQEDGSLGIVPADESRRRNGEDLPANGLTMIGLKRLDNLQRCLEEVLDDDVPGDLIETGVWRGGAAIFMRAFLKLYGVTDRVVWVADSFEGFPKAGAGRVPAHREEYVSVPLETVQENFRRLGLLDDQVKFLKGWFSDTLPGLSDRTWALIRLDSDFYESTMDSLVNLYPRLSPGGHVIVDDYALKACRQAVDDYRAAEGIEEEIHPIDRIAVYWRKREA